jgi:hypothetical protein
MTDAVQTFADSLRDSLSSNIFVKLNLSGYSGAEEGLKKIAVRKIVVKKTEKLSFTYSYKTRDIVKNYDMEDACARVEEFLQSGFAKAVLFTTNFDLAYPSLQKQKASHTEAPPLDHDRAKNRHVETSGKKYLQALKITDSKGEVFKTAQDKFKQIDKYIEILGGLLAAHPNVRRAADMGAGKGYLTFALYDYMTHALHRDAMVTGVEYRKDLVDLCNRVGKESGFSGLKFVQGAIDDFDASGTDLLIALHACDTATDDAIAKGIAAGAELIVVAPCCHKQIRREMEQGSSLPAFAPILKHGTFMERQAEMATDALRALYLESFGYAVKAFEFISDSHTPKNVMIVAEKTKSAPDRARILARAAALKEALGIKTHYLETLLEF